MFHFSTCKGVAYLPDVIKDSECNKQQCQETCFKIDRLQTELIQVKLARKQKFELFENEKSKIISQLKCIRKMIDKRFDDLEDKVRKRTAEETTKMEDIKMSDAQKLEHAELVLANQKQTLERLRKTGNTASIFVQTRLANKSLQETEEIERLLESMSLNHMYFLPNTSLGMLLEDIQHVGEIVEDIPTYTGELHKIACVKASSEKSVCTISGVCSLDDGEIIVSDWQNKSLKRLDDNYTIVEDLELPGQPYDICTVDSSTIAVSLTKSKAIQFVSVEKAMTNTSSFSVGDACRGIAYSDGLLYVACGGWKIFGEGQGHVEVYTTSGVLQRKFGDHVSQPGHIDLAFSRLYVTDNKTGLVIMDTNGHILKSFFHRDMSNPLAVCAGPGNQLFLGGWSTHNVMLLSNEGHLLLTLLTQKNGLKDLHTLFFDSLRTRLIYTMRDTNKMKVFALNVNTEG